MLWQGAPDARTLLRRVFHVRAVAAYFAVVLALCAATVISHGASPHAIRLSLLHRGELAVVPLVLMAVYAWAIQRSTVYSITNRRVVISFGLALPVTFNVPFSRITSAGLRLYANGAGDIPLQLLPGEKISYMVLWPHARPWRMARTEPMLRCVPDAAKASSILGAALAEHAAREPGRLVAFRKVRMPSSVPAQRGQAVAAE